MKNRVFSCAMQVPITGQWWSKRKKHRLHFEQWEARGGRHNRHVLHQRSVTTSPFASTRSRVEVEWVVCGS